MQNGDPCTDEETAVMDAHDETDYDFWDSFVFEVQRTPLEKRASAILDQLDFFFSHGADPGVWLFEESKLYSCRGKTKEYWLMDEMDISILNGDKGVKAELVLDIALLLWRYGLTDWSGYYIDIDTEKGIIRDILY